MVRHVLYERVTGFQEWKEGCGDGVCLGGSKCRGTWVVVLVHLCQGEDIFFLEAGVSLNVLAPHIPHMFKAEAAKPSNPQPHHCGGLRPLRCCSTLDMGVGTSLASARAADAGAALQK